MKCIKRVTDFLFFWDPQKSRNRDVLGSSRGARYWCKWLSQIWTNGEGMHELRDDWMEWTALAVPLDPAAKIVEPLPTKLNIRNAGTSNLMKRLWPLDWIGSCRIRWAIVNHKDCHSQFQNRIWESTKKVVILKILFLFERSHEVCGCYLVTFLWLDTYVWLVCDWVRIKAQTPKIRIFGRGCTMYSNLISYS